VGEQGEEEIGDQFAIQQGVTIQAANHVQVDDAQEDDNVPDVAAQQQQGIQTFDNNLVQGMQFKTFEQRYPFPENASRARRIRMLKLLKERNQNIGREGGEHINNELDYRISLEENMEEQEMTLDEAEESEVNEG
jgi:hypothetical protein